MPPTVVQIISVGVGEPDFDTPEVIVQAGIEALKSGKTRYTPNAGSSALRSAICKKLLGGLPWGCHVCRLLTAMHAC